MNAGCGQQRNVAACSGQPAVQGSGVLFLLLAMVGTVDAGAKGPCGTTAQPGGPACVDTPPGWKSSDGDSCGDYAVKEYCTKQGGYGKGWPLFGGSFDRYASGGVSADVACCKCGGGTTISGDQACQGHGHDEDACNAVGCCKWSLLLGCSSAVGAQQCHAPPCGTTVAPPDEYTNNAAVVGGTIAAATALAAAGALSAHRSASGTTQEPAKPTQSPASAQGAQTSAQTTTTTENSSSDLLWLWLLLGLLALCCLLALCGGVAAALLGRKKKKKRSTGIGEARSKSFEQAPGTPVSVGEQERERLFVDDGGGGEAMQVLPMVPPLLPEMPTNIVPTIVAPSGASTPMQMSFPVVSSGPSMVAAPVTGMNTQMPGYAYAPGYAVPLSQSTSRPSY